MTRDRGPASRTRALSRFLGPEAATTRLRVTGSRLLRRTLAESRGPVAALIVVNAAGLVATVLVPAALAAALDAAIAGHPPGAPLARLGLLLGVLVVHDALDELIGSATGAAMTARLRHRLLRRALALGLPERRPFPPGEVLSRLAVNAGSAAGFLPVLLSAATTALAALAAVVGLAVIDWRIAATFLVGVPVGVVLVRSVVARATEPFVRYQQVQARVVGRLLDAFGGARTIRACGTTEREIGRVLEPLPELHAAGRQIWTLQGRATWRLMLLTPMIQVAVLAVAGLLLTSGSLTPGELVAAASYAAMALGAVGLADTLVSLLGCQVGAGRVGEVLAAPVAVEPPAAPVPVPPGPGRIEIRGVTVRREGRPVLDSVDLTVPAGGAVAVVGRSGSGKSTLARLLGRLADPDDGDVLLDGVPVRRWPLLPLRRAVTYAFERPALLGTTVHDTIAYGRPEASRDDVVRAARVARADAFVRHLPEGYDTPLTRAPMSGGELQRLGLARAVLAGGRVIVLDDATSSLDTATEVEVANALGRALAGRTSVTVAHRASTAARADLVVWLDGGRVRAVAPHHVLRSDPAYRELFGVPEPAR